jgi:phage tail-like protein
MKAFMAAVEKTSKPHLMEYLPSIYQEAEPARPKTFLGQFLLVFEKVLLGLDEDLHPLRDAHGDGEEREESKSEAEAEEEIEGLGEKIAGLHTLFDPAVTPEEFLPWLAGWAALSLRFDLSSARKRKLLANIIPLYRIRGTRKYVEELLMLCVDAVVSVSDAELPPLQIGVHSTLDSDTYIGGGPPYFFSVTLVAPKLTQQQKEKQMAIAHSVIELAKPAHTFYELSIVSPRMQFGVHSTVGLDTVLAPPSA